MANSNKTTLSIGGLVLVVLLALANHFFGFGFGAAAGSKSTPPAEQVPASAPAESPVKTPTKATAEPSKATAPTKAPAVAPVKAPVEPVKAPVNAPAPAPVKAPAQRVVGFTSERSLNDHFDKHGHEFALATVAEYLAMAQELRDRAAGPDVLEATRKDGVITRFDRKSGAFLAFNRDRTIRTLFRPNDGERYFRRQAEREN